MALLDLLGRRWALRILWELRDGPLPFNELQRRCDQMSPSTLSQRLADLTEANLIESTADGAHRATRQADQLGQLLMPLDAWSKKWSRSL